MAGGVAAAAMARVTGAGAGAAASDIKFGSLSGAESVKRITVWRPVMVFEWDKKGKKWRKRASALIYDATGTLGALFWCDRGGVRSQTLERCVDVEAIESTASAPCSLWQTW